MDTRTTGGPYNADSWHTIVVGGRFGVPVSGVTALAVTFTVVKAAGPGYLSDAPASAPRSHETSAINWNKGDTVSNSAVTSTDDNGNFQVYVASSTNIVVDVQGYFSAADGDTAPGGFVPLPNGGSRTIDTRATGSAAGNLSPGSTYIFSGRQGGVPASAAALFVNITVVPHTSVAGHITPFATGTPQPTTSLNFRAGQPTALASVVGVDSNGQFDLYVGASAAIDVTVDVQGYYTSAATTAEFTPQSARVFDSRVTTAIASNSLTKIEVSGLKGIPNVGHALADEVINVVAISTSAANNANLRLWGTTQAEPTATADLNLKGAETVSNLVTIAPGSDNSIFLRYNGAAGSSSINVVLDVEGWYGTASSASVPGAPQSVSATAGDGTATVSFSPPTSDGGAPITSYQVIASPNGQIASSTGSPIVISGLHDGTPYLFTVTATNSAGEGPQSAVSNLVTPSAINTVPGAPQCQTSALQATEPHYVPNTARLGFTLRLTNTSDRPCGTRGWPGVSFRSSAGSDIADAARQGQPSQVELKPGASTFVEFYLSNPAGGNGCARRTYGSMFLLTPPGGTTSWQLHLPDTTAICHPVVYPVGVAA